VTFIRQKGLGIPSVGDTDEMEFRSELTAAPGQDHSSRTTDSRWNHQARGIIKNPNHCRCEWQYAWCLDRCADPSPGRNSIPHRPSNRTRRRPQSYPSISLVTDRTYDSDGLDDDLKQDGMNETFSIDQGGCSSKCS